MSNPSGVSQSNQATAGHGAEITPDIISEPVMAADQSDIDPKNNASVFHSERRKNQPQHEAQSPTRSDDSLCSDPAREQPAEYLDDNSVLQPHASVEDQYETMDDEITPTRFEPVSWDDLQKRFEQRLLEKYQEEQGILQELQRLTEFYNIWAQAGANREQERASKRLRTRIAHVRNSEIQLQDKQEHHATVVEAFESALQLLRGL